MYGQGGFYLTESLDTSDSYETTPQCGITNGTQQTVSCSQTWVVQGASGGMQVMAKNGYGVKKMYTHTEVLIGADGVSASDSAAGGQGSEDTLSVVGLTGQPTALVRIEAECASCAVYSSSDVIYTLQAWWGPTENYSSTCVAGLLLAPNCTLNVPVLYDISTRQPYPIVIAPYLVIENESGVINGEAGNFVETTIDIGFDGTLPATVRAEVIKPNGAVIEGVTVLGASGYIYN